MQSRFLDTQSFLALFLVGSLVGLAYALVYTGKTDTDMFKILVGGMMTVGFASVIGFYFGSSSGSREKDTAMSAVVERLTPPTLNGAVTAAAAAAAPKAAAAAAPQAAAVAAPPAAEVAVDAELDKRGIPDAKMEGR